MDDKTVSEKSVDKPTKQASSLALYDSNPFTAAWAGLQKLVKTNAQTVVGVALFNIVLFVVLGLTGLVVVFSIFAFLAKHDPSFPTWIFPSYNSFDFVNSMNDLSIYLTWAIGFVICVLVMTLTQSLQLNLSLAAAKSVPLKFGALLKASMGSVLPIVGFVCLMILAFIVGAVALGLLALVLGPITLVVGVVALAAAIYAGLRLSFATYVIVDRRLSPVAAVKNSWKLTDGHLIETVGSGAVAWIILAVPSLIMNALARITEGAPMVSGIFSLLDLALVVVLVIGAAMAIAERYVQLQALANKELKPVALSPFNYLAVLVMLILAPILQALSPTLKDGNGQPFQFYDNAAPLREGESKSPYPTSLN